MDTPFLQIVSDVLPDLQKFFATVDQFPQKNPETWQQIATQLGGRHEPDRLERIHASLCDYFGEPKTTTSLRLRFLYEIPVSPEQITGFPFLNLGYHPTEDGPPIQDLELGEKDRKYRCNSALYRLWLKSADLEGKDVVEVGSGRGAGASFLSRHFGPRSYTAIDGSRQQVAMCSKAYPDIRFVHGLASALPLPDASTDLVLNVESSHCYSDLEKFFSEVHRVLREDGTFILTDILYRKSQVISYLNLLERYFHVQGKRDITKNVIACLEPHGPDQFIDFLQHHVLGQDRGKSDAARVSNHTILYAGARIFLPMDIAPLSNYRALSVGEAVYVSFRCVRKD